MKILVVEDEPKIAATLHKGLNERGFEVDLAGDGMDGIFLATHHPYDLVILDMMLPLHDGWSVRSRIREAGFRTPVLFLTACDSVPERARGLEPGADDYLTKPLAFSELLARVRSLLQRGPVAGTGTLRIAALEIDVPGQRVTRAGRSLSLTPKEFVLLSL
ncbi:MAG TPA: response regulator, partial [Burkholderiales bacterium]